MEAISQARTMVLRPHRVQMAGIEEEYEELQVFGAV